LPIFLRPGGGPDAPPVMLVRAVLFEFMLLDIILLIEERRFKALLLESLRLLECAKPSSELRII